MGHKASALRHDDEGGGGIGPCSTGSTTTLFWSIGSPRRRRPNKPQPPPPPPLAAIGRARTATTSSTLSTPSSSSPPSSAPCRLAALPNEILTMVLTHLETYDLQMVSETCRALQQAAIDDPSLWAHVELPVHDGRLSQEDKEQFLCRLLLPPLPPPTATEGGTLPSSPPWLPTAEATDDTSTSSKNDNDPFVTPTKTSPAAPPAAASAAAAALNPTHQGDDEEEDNNSLDDGADFPRAASMTRRASSSSSDSGSCSVGSGSHGYDHHHDPAASSPPTPTTPPQHHLPSPYGCRAPHVRSLSLLGARDVTGGCLLAFSPSPAPGRVGSASALAAATAAAAASPPLCSLQELDLSHCPSLRLNLLVQALPSIRRSLTTLSLRNTCHLLNDAAIAAILAPLSLRPPDQAPTAGGGGGGGVTGLRALHLGTSTRRGGARPPASELTDATLHLLATCCPRLENLNIHNQASVTDEGVVALVRSVGGTLQGLDLGLCASLSDASVVALAAHCRGLRRLSLRNCWRVTDAAVRALLRANRGLEALNVYACTFVSPQAFDLRPSVEQQQPAAAAAAAVVVGMLGVGAAAGAAASHGRGERDEEEGSLALREANLSYMRGLHGPALLRLARRTRHQLRELSVAKCDSLTNAALARLCLLCRLEALNVADCLGVDARFIYILARRAAPCGTTPGSGRSSSSAPAAGAAGSENEEEDDDEEAWPASRPAPLGALHSLNARQCRGWTDATTAALLSPEGCGARNLRRLYLGDTAAVATGGGSGGSGMEEEQGGLEDGEGDGDELWNPAGAATTSSAAAIAIDKVTIPSSLNPQHPHPHRHVAAGLPPTDAAAGVGMVGAAAAAGLTDESMVLIAQTLGRGLQILDLKACAAVTDRGVLALFASCHRLQRLVLSGLPCITDACLHALLPSPPSSPAAAADVVPQQRPEDDADSPAASSFSSLEQHQQPQPQPPPTTVVALQRSTGRLPCLVDLHLNLCPRLSLHAVHELRRQRPDVLRVFNRRDLLLRGPPAF